MEFKFKRKYTNFFIFALLLHIAIISFWLFSPTEKFIANEWKEILITLSFINCELILIFYLGLFRKKYFAYFDKLVIKRSFHKTIYINYKDIAEIKEKSTDSILLGFGIRPSFTIYYSAKNRRKKTTIRSDNNKLLLTVISNELKFTNK